MLSFWISAALLTVLAVLAVARPLLKPADQYGARDASRSAADAAVYRDQLAEIEADRARGLISDTEAEAARVEIARRLLASAEPGTASTARASAPSAGTGPDKLFLIVAGMVPMIAIGLYAKLGSPGLPDRPISERLAKAPSPNADIDELIARVEAQLRANPADGKGWDVIAPVYLRLERFADAAEAYRRALDLEGETARRLSGLAESTVLANDGIVTETARRAYQRILELEPDRTEALFGLALAKEQDGDLDEAEAAYRKLAENAPPSVPWRVFVMERMEAIAQKRGPGGVGPAPDAAAAETIAGMPEQQRRQIIHQMVQGLAARLKENGRDVDGWQRLMRSWTVLGDIPQAEAALVDARKALAGDDKALAEINAFARSLGLKS